MGLSRRSFCKVLAELAGASAMVTPNAWGAPLIQEAPPVRWFDCKMKSWIPEPEVVSRIGARDYLYLGDVHNSTEVHRRQLDLLSLLQVQGRQITLGLESFEYQSGQELSRYLQGEIEEAALLLTVKWDKSWGGDPEHYLPFLRFARSNGVQIVGLRASPTVESIVSQSGWFQGADFEGLTAPAPPSRRYVQTFLDKFLQHHSTSLDARSIGRMVAIQQLWDRAFAQYLVQQTDTGKLGVGIVGASHLEAGLGVPAQLTQLGTSSFSTVFFSPKPFFKQEDAEKLGNFVCVF